MQSDDDLRMTGRQISPIVVSVQFHIGKSTNRCPVKTVKEPAPETLQQPE